MRAAWMAACALGAALFGGIALVGGLRRMNENLHFVQTGLRTTGVVVANHRVHGRGGGTYYPQVRFVLPGGQTYEVRGTTDGADPPEFRVGQNVTVYYDPQHPQTALIDSWKDLWLFPLLWIVMGTVFWLVAAMPLLQLPRRRTPTHTRTSPIRPRRNAPARRHR
jgi:Protein of unknown function (DUF3592)